jgi:quinol monooxygenase YgiN
MIVIVGTVSFPPDKVASVTPHIEALVHATRAEDGCVSYAYAEDVLRPGVMHISEVWRDWAALGAHRDAPHMTTWRAASAEHGIHDRDLTAFEADKSRKL